MYIADDSASKATLPAGSICVYIIWFVVYFFEGSADLLADIGFIGRQWLGRGVVDAAALEEIGR